jgi:hypothetical protein
MMRIELSLPFKSSHCEFFVCICPLYKTFLVFVETPAWCSG